MIPLTRPLVAYDDVADDIRAILDSGTLTLGPYVRRFEEAVADYVGTAHAVATTSATTALHLALVAAGVQAGDEVLVADFSFPATGNVVTQCGAVPVLVDCRPGTFLLDPADVEAKLTERTVAVMPVDAFGEPADMAVVVELAGRNGLTVVEDAACALGATREGIQCGAWVGAGCFSFHPRKVITTGEGGMVTTDDGELFARLDLLRHHGGVSGRVGMDFHANGFNYRLSEIQAALGLAQMRVLDDMLAGRRAAAALYLQRLAGWEHLTVPAAASVGRPTYQSFVVLLGDDVDRDGVVASLATSGIQSTLGTYAMHAQPAFARFGYAPGDLPNAWRAQRQSLTVPLWPGMAESVVDEVVDALEVALTACLRVAPGRS